MYTLCIIPTASYSLEKSVNLTGRRIKVCTDVWEHEASDYVASSNLLYNYSSYLRTRFFFARKDFSWAHFATYKTKNYLLLCIYAKYRRCASLEIEKVFDVGRKAGSASKTTLLLEGSFIFVVEVIVVVICISCRNTNYFLCE